MWAKWHLDWFVVVVVVFVVVALYILKVVHRASFRSPKTATIAAIAIVQAKQSKAHAIKRNSDSKMV